MFPATRFLHEVGLIEGSDSLQTAFQSPHEVRMLSPASFRVDRRWIPELIAKRAIG